MWPMNPSCDEASSVSSSVRDRSGSNRRQMMAWKQESQYHCQS